MKKVKLLIVWALFGAMPLFSQVLTLKSGERVVNNDTVRLYGTLSTELIEARLSVTNNRTTPVSLKIRKSEILLAEGAECSFCWGECYIPSVSLSPRAITIEPGSTDASSFIGEYRPYETEGTSVVKFTFFDPADTTFQQDVTVMFVIGASGLNDTGISQEPFRISQDIGGNFIRIEFLTDGQPGRSVSLLAPDGRQLVMRRIPAGTQTAELPVEDLPAGLYVIRIQEGSRAPVAKRVVIMR